MSTIKRLSVQLFSSTPFRRHQPHLNKISHLARKTARFRPFTVEDRFDQQRERKAAGERLNGEALRLASRWLARADREAALADFGLIGEDREGALAEAGAELVELIDGEAGAEVAAAVARVLITAGWPAKAHRVGAIATRTKVAEAPPEAVAALQGVARRGALASWRGGA
jgi:hypothetical protein